MAYASLPDVQALNGARVYSASSIPATTAIGQFLDQTAAVIDAILVEKGYSIPIPSTASSALLLLQEVNALGGWAKVEQAAEASDKRELALSMWHNALDMLKTQNTILDIPKNPDRSDPRGPGLTTANVDDRPLDPYHDQLYGVSGNQASQSSNRPLFTRTMKF